jgi:hypothetical protein
MQIRVRHYPLFVVSCTVITLFACKDKAPASSSPPITLSTPVASTAVAPASPVSAPPAGAVHADLTPLGQPLYPTVFESAWTGDLTGDKEAARIGQMSSHDSFDAVYTWYREHMPAGTEPAEVAASNHTTEEGDRMAVFQVGESGDTKMTRVMILRGKADDYTIINIASHVNKQ